MSLSAASAALIYYKKLIIALKRIKEAATQPDELLNEEDNKEDDKEDSTLSDKEALNKDFNSLICGYISFLSNQLPNTL